MGSPTDRLSPLQRQVLGAFFREAPDAWFLTGGAALGGFWLGHRTTLDLDLFAAEGDLADGVGALRRAADGLGAVPRQLIHTPDFARFLVSRDEDGVVVDLVRDRVPQLLAKTVVAHAIRLDSIREIAANKLTTLVNRSEPRDLVDLRALLETGLSLDTVLADAVRKDLSADPATLAWVLSTSSLPEAGVPEGYLHADLLAFRAELEADLRRRSAPPVG
ncbi:MAG: nucleotidyl transferase AbiEii/AbiGii toxin family protein [Deltaproteobacteria bacterium]|nr:nucleotidyl transferase AbiEii/AbiGii toxin family protein [Deltaproteobacteria bacterium]